VPVDLSLTHCTVLDPDLKNPFYSSDEAIQAES